jgi:hypothetical protein
MQLEVFHGNKLRKSSVEFEIKTRASRNKYKFDERLGG